MLGGRDSPRPCASIDRAPRRLQRPATRARSQRGECTNRESWPHRAARVTPVGARLRPAFGRAATTYHGGSRRPKPTGSPQRPRTRRKRVRPRWMGALKRRLGPRRVLKDAPAPVLQDASYAEPAL